ncbi:MAG: hypothetical protein EA420_01120 [Candidatus Competibacteraceae bacterium]|nr:MAG: hypothetical protein EA420_01120 [Candidatus Competibacteraceae bacterium]
MSLFVGISPNVQRKINELLRKRHLPDSALRWIGERYARDARNCFAFQRAPSGQAWPPLAPETLHRKQKERARFQGVGRWSGALQRSVRWRWNRERLEIGTSAPHAAWFGLGNQRLPARPFLGADRPVDREVLRYLQQFEAVFPPSKR